MEGIVPEYLKGGSKYWWGVYLNTEGEYIKLAAASDRS
jgi:hypothetical protein